MSTISFIYVSNNKKGNYEEGCYIMLQFFKVHYEQISHL